MAEQAFHKLPLHLISLVLSQLDNMQSLASAIFSHSSVYAAFAEDRNRIVSTIMTNQIPADTMRYALCTHAAATSTTLNRRDMAQISRFLVDHFRNDPDMPEDPFALPGPLDLHLASALSRTHAMVQHFTRDLLRDTLPLVREHLGLQRRDEITASPEEEFRIHRAMYRFQLYCNLFRQTYNDEQARQLRVLLHTRFFNYFSPWVNEQLACIHDYFERVLSRAFNEVAKHDVGWGAKGVDWLADGRVNEHKQGYLFYGISFLYELDQATTYEQRLHVLRSKEHAPPLGEEMLASQFYCGSTRFDYADWCHIWRRLGLWIEQAKYNSVSYRWPNNGPDIYGSAPFHVWYQSHALGDYWNQHVIYHEAHGWLRRCGYVLWDHPETLLSEPELSELIHKARMLDFLTRCRRNGDAPRAEMRRSWEMRAKIYKLGGRGYWSDGDLSQITWTEGPPAAGWDCPTLP